MKRETIIAAGAALLGVVAVAITASTLEERRDPAGNGGGGGDGGQILPETEPVAPDAGGQIPYLTEILLIVVVVFAILGLYYILRNPRQTAKIVAITGLIVAVLLLIFQFLPEGMFEGQDPLEYEENVSPGPGENGEGEPGETEPQIEWSRVIAMLGIFGLLLLAVIVVATRTPSGVLTDSEIGPDTDSGNQPDDEAVAAEIGAAAGRAADRLEDSDAYENEVYRAWAEMVALLDVGEPASATPRIFAEEAISAGLEREDVTALTGLFEEVRYGDRPPTRDREETAVDLLRRIERRYARGD